MAAAAGRRGSESDVRREASVMALEQYATQVSGTNKGDILLYALSTCGWCRKTKNLLSDLGVQYRYIDVDLLQGEARAEVVDEIRRWNPNRSFPTVVIDNSKCIVGFREDELKEALRVAAS
jgi:glutaredoxin-like protein NrdH